MPTMQKHHFPLVTFFSLALLATVIIAVALGTPNTQASPSPTSGNGVSIQEPQTSVTLPSQAANNTYVMPQQWVYTKANFYKTMLGETQPTSVFVDLYLPAENTTLEGSLLGTGCIEQKVSNGNPYQGVAGEYTLSFKQACKKEFLNEKRLSGSWVEIGTLSHRADDGSIIHVVRIPGATSNQFNYVFALAPEGVSIKNGDLYTDTYYIYPPTAISDANQAVLVDSVVLTLNTQDSQKRGVLTAIADKIVLNVKRAP